MPADAACTASGICEKMGDRQNGTLVVAVLAVVLTAALIGAILAILAVLARAVLRAVLGILAGTVLGIVLQAVLARAILGTVLTVIVIAVHVYSPPLRTYYWFWKEELCDFAFKKCAKSNDANYARRWRH